MSLGYGGVAKLIIDTWKVYDNDIDMVAMTLLRIIFNEYQMEGMKKEVTCFFK